MCLCTRFRPQNIIYFIILIIIISSAGNIRQKELEVRVEVTCFYSLKYKFKNVNNKLYKFNLLTLNN